MLDIRLIRETSDHVKQRLATRGGDTHLRIDQVLEIDRDRRASETRLQQLQGDRKRISKEIGARKGRGEETGEVEAQVRGIGDEIARLNEDAAALDQRQRELLMEIPNVPHDACPIGHDATANPVVRTWGEKPTHDFSPRSHIDIGAALGLFDFERAAKVAGSAFTCFTGPGARLERSLINFLLDLHTREHGYGEVSPPFVANTDALIGTTQLPKFEEQQYRIDRDGLYMVPTAEVPVTNLHREEILRLDQLPIRYAAYTPCFRREAGAAGVGTRGLIRMHQFDKVELVKIVHPENSFPELEALTADAERVLQILGLHYRTIELCTGDIGFGATKTYDIEVWAPGQNAYLEVSSCSNFGDFQARRMNLRFKDAEGKNRFCHTLNGSGTALPRLYVALLETYQQADGSVIIPEPLRPYFGGIGSADDRGNVSAITPIYPPSPDAAALVGVSGGRDSVALLHAMAQGGWRRLMVCHLDHALRNDSAEDAQFACDLAVKYGFAAVTEREEVAIRAGRAGQSIETAAREARHAFFARVQEASGSDGVYLAHHADDQVETFLFRLLRGSGTGGLAAMRAEARHLVGSVSLRIVRPFLPVWREDIDAYVAKHLLAFREDGSNTDRSHTRNRLRHEALPALEATFGRDVRKAIWRAAEILRAEDEILTASPELNVALGPRLSVADLRVLPVALQRRQLHRWLRAQGVQDVGFEIVEAARSLLTVERPAKINLAGSRHVRRRAGRLFLE